MSTRAWSVALPIAIVVGVAVGAFVAWWLWPVHCESTAIGFAPGTPDPNIHLCTLRSGAVSAWDTAEDSAVTRGAATGFAAAAGGLTALRSVHRTRRRGAL